MDAPQESFYSNEQGGPSPVLILEAIGDRASGRPHAPYRVFETEADYQKHMARVLGPRASQDLGGPGASPGIGGGGRGAEAGALRQRKAPQGRRYQGPPPGMSL
jgi:hypothetical protein